MSILNKLLNMDSSTKGKWIDSDSFLYLNNKSGVSQIWKKENGKEGKQITFLKDRIWDLDIAPNGKDIIFLMDTDGDEQAQIYYLKDGINGGNEPINLIDNRKARCQYAGIKPDGKTIVYVSNERNSANFDICEIDINTKEKTIIIKNDDNYNFPVGLSKDGKYLLVNKLKAQTDDFLWLANLETGEFTKINEKAENASYSSPAWLSDNKGFYFASDYESEFKYLGFYDMETKEITKLFEPNWDVEDLFLSPDNSLLAVFVNIEGYTELLVFDTENMSNINIPRPPKGTMEYYGLDWSEDSRKLLFTLASGKRPTNIWSIDLDKDMVKRETTSNADKSLLDSLIEPELCSYKSFDGLKISYWHYKAKENNNAVVIDIHGGPEGQAKLSYDPIIQELLYQGIDVIEPNVRGSVGYGKSFHLLDNVEKRLDSVKDIEALYNHIVENSVADKDKIAVMGGSYGGYMTLASLGFYPDLWAAGIDIVGMSDLETFLENTADYRRSHRESEYGTLANDRETLRRVSPIHKADEIVAPLMVVHGANDPRVPLSEAEQIIESLESRNVPVESLIYYDEGHGLFKRENQLDAYPKMIDFLRKHLDIDTDK